MTYLVPGPVAQVELGLLHVERHARLLGHHLHVDGLAGLDAHHQLVPVDLRRKQRSEQLLPVRCWREAIQVMGMA